jgi:hypothetical protein
VRLAGPCYLAHHPQEGRIPRWRNCPLLAELSGKFITDNYTFGLAGKTPVCDAWDRLPQPNFSMNGFPPSGRVGGSLSRPCLSSIQERGTMSRTALGCLVALVLLSATTPVWAAPPDRDAAAVAAAIDREIDKRLADAGIPASPRADDAEFLRRVTLDITGRIPTLDRTIAFLDSKAADKRRKLIDELLASKEYGQHLGTLWRNLLAPPGNPVKGKAPPDRFSPWLAEQFNRNRGWDDLVRELLTVEGDAQKMPQSAFIMTNSESFRPQANLLAASTTRLFLGVRLGCAECHDHPFAAWKQTDFWGAAAFFGRLRNTGKKGPPYILTETPDPQPPGKDDPVRIHTAPGGIVIPASAGKASGQTVKARFLGGPAPELDEEKPFRPAFADWVVARDNPFFARAFVNRTWAQFFGRGFVQPVDDFREDNAASHPALLKLLVDEFRDAAYDCKHLIRCLCNSQAYQRTSRPTAGNEKDAELWSHMVVKVLSAEAFYDSLSVVTAIDKSSPVKGRPVSFEARDDFVQFFRPQGESEETGIRQGIPQFLKRLNSEAFNQGAPLIDRLLYAKASREQVIEKLYLATLTRRPRAEEVALLTEYLDRRTSEEKGYAGVLWILLSSGEFVLNH